MGMAMPLTELSERELRRFSGFVLSEMGLARGHIAAMLEVSPRTLPAWDERFAAGPNVWDAPRSGRKRTYDKDAEDRFIAFYCQTSPLKECGRGRWSLRTAENELEKDADLVGAALSRSTMQRMLSRHGLKPHLVRYFLQITDPDFFPKMEHLIELYSSQPDYLFCFDECPGLQILQRIAPDARPDDEGAASRWLSEFEYIRNGTMDVFAFLEVRTGKVHAECHGDHTKSTFVAVFRGHVSRLPTDARLHYVMDNLDSHCSYDFCRVVAELSGIECPPKGELQSRDKRREWLRNDDKRIVIHFTPFHGSWLNMVEIWFRIMGRMCLNDSYCNPDQLRDAILEFAETWSENWCHPFNWGYDGTGLHQKAVLRFIGMLTHSAGEMTLQLMTKESKLMVNLMNDYWEKVDSEHWRQLFEATHQAAEQLRENIHKSVQPIVKKRAEDALSLLLRTIESNTERAVADQSSGESQQGPTAAGLGRRISGTGTDTGTGAEEAPPSETDGPLRAATAA